MKYINMKGNKKIPANWCVKSTNESDKVLIKWRGGNYSSRPAYCCSDKVWIGEYASSYYQEITLEEFKEYILGEKRKSVNYEIY